MLPFISPAGAILLIALSFGYIVCYLAEREEKGLRLVGYGIGTFVIVFSLLMLIGGSLLGLGLRSGMMKSKPPVMRQMIIEKQMKMHEQMVPEARPGKETGKRPAPQK